MDIEKEDSTLLKLLSTMNRCKEVFDCNELTTIEDILNKAMDEIQALRAKVASAEVLAEALRFYAEKHNWIDVEVKNGNHFAAIVNTDRVPDFVNYYKSSIATAGKRAIEALTTYDKLSEVKHDTK